MPLLPEILGAPPARTKPSSLPGIASLQSESSALWFRPAADNR